MKNFISALTFTLAVVVFFPTMTCEATDYYIGVYDDGSEAYLMTETIKDRSEYDYLEYSLQVKAVYNSSSVKYVDYIIEAGPVFEVTKNGKYYSFRQVDKIFPEGTVERNILQFLTYKWK